MARRRLEALVLTEVEKSELTALTARPKTAQALAERARIVLACADGLGEQGGRSTTRLTFPDSRQMVAALPGAADGRTAR